jgi:hypothetical protein
MENIGNMIDDFIRQRISELLNNNKDTGVPSDLIETDNFGEIIEKLCILHCRMWYLEDTYKSTDNDEILADVKRKLDICFKNKRPKLVEAINRLIDKSIKENKTLIEDSVKYYNN